MNSTVRLLISICASSVIVACSGGGGGSSGGGSTAPSTGGTDFSMSPSLKINNGISATNDTNVNLQIAGTDATEMYITSTPGCAADGTWEPYNAAKVWSISNINSNNYVYLKLRKDETHVSQCIAATILHDGVPPTMTITPSSDIATQSNRTNYGITGTCSDEGQLIDIRGDATGTATCSSGAWTATLNLSALPDGNVNLQIRHRDLAGNFTADQPVTIVKTTVAPTITAFSVNGGATKTNSLNVSLSLASADAVDMYITQDSSCNTGGVWETFSSSKAWTLTTANTTNQLYAKVRDITGTPSMCSNIQIQHSNIPPSIAITTPAANSYINASNQNSFVVGGTCSENGASVAISGGVSGSGTCSSNVWSATLNASAASEGAVALTATLTDSFGNTNSANLNVVKDTIAPSGPSIAITGGATLTNLSSVSVDLAAASASEMIVGSSATCAGTWEPMAATKSVSIASLNSLNRFYAKFRDNAGNETTCVQTSITHDNLLPTVTATTPILAANQSNSSSYLISGTCSENGRSVSISGDLTSSVMCSSNSWTTLVDVSSLSDGTVTLYLDHNDIAGNTAAQASLNITKDTVVPTLTNFRINSGAAKTNSLSVSLQIQSSDAAQMLISNNSDCSTGAIFEAYAATKSWNLATANAMNNVYIKLKDSAGNISSCESAGIEHSNAVPAIAISSPNANSYIGNNNKAAFNVSGSCSEEAATVTISGDGAGSATCSSGSWSASIDLSLRADGNVNLTASTTNAFGNSSNASRIFIKDTVPPQSASLATQGGLTITNVNTVNLTPAALQASEMMIGQDPTCALGSWEAYATAKSLPVGSLNATNTYYVKYRDLALNETSCISASILHDNVAGEVAFTSPANNSIVNTSNMAAFVVSGTCTEDSQVISIKGDVTSSSSCASGVWTKTLDLSSLADGSINIAASIVDAAGNISGDATLTLVKDATPPTGGTIAINSGASFTNNATVSLALAATSADQMYITEDPDCLTGGTWEAYAVSKSWNLVNTDQLANTSVKFRDTNGNESVCVSAYITHDSIAPSWSDSINHVALYNSLTDSPEITYSETAADTGSGVAKYQYAIGTATTGTNAYNKKAWTDVSGGVFTASGLSLLNGTTYYVNMKAIDNAGNWTSLSSVGWKVDSVAPNLSFTAPLANDRITDPDVKMTGTCETGLLVSFTYSSGITGPASLTCAANAFTTYAQITGPVGAYSIQADSNDGINFKTTTVNINYINRFEVRGQVLASTYAPDGGLILGGDFSYATNSTQFYYSKVDNTGAKLPFSIGSGFNGQVWAVVELADGSLLVGGEFTTYRKRTANRLAKINSDGSLDTSFNNQSGNMGFNNIVRTLAVTATDVYVGGDFTTYKAGAANRIAKINISTGAIDTTFNPTTGNNGFNNTVSALAVNGADLFVGGAFTTYRAAAANYVAKVNASTGVLDSVFNPASGSNGANNRVRAIITNGTDVYIGGDFTTYRAAAANRLAKISYNGVLDTVFNPASGGNGAGNSSVFGLSFLGSDVIAVGSFTLYRAANAYRIVKVSPTGVADTSFNAASTAAGFNNTAFTVSVSGSDIYVGGIFTTFKSTPARRMVRLSNTGVLSTSFSPASGTQGFDGYVNAIAVGASGIHVVGSFTAYRGEVLAGNFIKFNSNGTVDTVLSPQTGPIGFNGAVRAVAVDSTSIYVGGDFTTYKGAPANRIAKIDLATGALDTTFNPATGNNGFNNTVRTILLSGSTVFVGGNFTTYRAAKANYVAKLNASGVLDTVFNPNVTASGVTSASSSVYALATDGTSLYIGGVFTAYRSVTCNRVAKVDYNGVLDTSFSTPTGLANNSVYSLALSGSSLFIGGAFTTWNGAAANRIAKVNAVTNALDTTFNPATGGNGAASNVLAIATDGTSIYLAGDFTTYRGTAANRVAKINFSGVLDTVFNPTTGANGLAGINPLSQGSATANTLSLGTGSAFVGGSFTTYKGKAANFHIKLGPTGAELD